MSKRKSQIGSNAKVSKEPPAGVNGEPWWTTPPTVMQLGHHMEYVRLYRQQLIESLSGMKHGKRCRAAQLIARVNEWIKGANEIAESQRAEELGLDDPAALISALRKVVWSMSKQLGGNMPEEHREVMKAAYVALKKLKRGQLVSVGGGMKI